MGLDYRPQTVTAAQFAEIFARERAQEYPAVDAFETRMGFAVDRGRLEAAAEILCCPFKAHPPSWQHGRVIYAALRHYLYTVSRGRDTVFKHVDVGTAKGFSALCARWALDDAHASAPDWLDVAGVVQSVDVLPQTARLRRNTVAEVDGLKTLAEVLAPFAEAKSIHFHETTGLAFLQSRAGRIHSAFIDGKHSTEAVGAEWRALAQLQEPGDLAIFDDVQMPPVAAGLKGAGKAYDFETLTLDGVNRAYMIGVRR